MNTDKVQSIKAKYNIRMSSSRPSSMIFLHGFGCDQSMWRSVAPEFEKDYQVVLYDQIGSGGTNKSLYDWEKYSSLRGYAQDVIEIIEGLELKQSIFVGHSVGATIGILAAIERPELFQHLILIGPSPCYFNDGDYQGGFERSALEKLLNNADADYLGWARAMAPAIMAREDRPELNQELTNSFCKTDAEIARHFARVLFLADHRADLPFVKTPSLILQCSQDIVAPESVGRYLHEQMQKSIFHQLKAIGHCPHVSEPGETVKAMKEYLNSRCRGTRSSEHAL